jgi:antitoxin component of RelBE/YafQ-DinJ toxin-antitoxin module
MNNYKVNVPNHDMNLKINPSKPIELCIYQVYWHNTIPIMLFLLNKKNAATLSFVEFINNRATNAEKIKHNIIKYISQFFSVVTITYHGVYETAEKNVIILNYDDQYKYNSTITTGENSYLWSTAYEVINVNKIYNYILDSNVTDFFINNPEFLRISQQNGIVYETPIVCYYKTKKTNSIDEVDIYRESIIPGLPKSYFLYSSGCIPKLLDEDITILRIAVFKGKLAFKDIELYNTDNSYDTLFCIYKNVNRYYVMRNYSQHTILSIL